MPKINQNSYALSAVFVLMQCLILMSDILIRILPKVSSFYAANYVYSTGSVTSISQGLIYLLSKLSIESKIKSY